MELLTRLARVPPLGVLAAFNRTTAGEIIGRMEAAGLLERRDSERDRRFKNIFITKVG